MSVILRQNMAREIKLTSGEHFQQPSQVANTKVMGRLYEKFMTEERLAKLYPRPEFHMEQATQTILGQEVQAKTSRLSARWTFEAVADDQPFFSGEDFLLEGFETSMMQIIIDHRERDEIVCPYVPIVSSGFVIDPESYQPILTFTTRYGVYKA